ncbi:Internalin [Phytophthora megakarya]|uniref:Internalin n=1 Tax=Phytophthora megakarya TaxID=4795 RepID=A0A225UEJ2_9STRA|nr:Internalin [Phytophthora megakarya]
MEREGQMTDLQFLRHLTKIEGPEGQEHQDQSEIEGPDEQGHQDQPEFEGPDDQEHQDLPEFEGPDDQEHQYQSEFEGPDDQELEDKREIPSGGGGSPGDHDSPPPDHSPATPPPSRLLAEALVVVLRGLHPPLFPAEASIPHYSDLKLFTAAEIHPWDPTIVGTVPIIAMIQATLTKRMPIPANFLFPYRVPPVRAPMPVVGYCSGLITGANVLALMATEPWRILGRRRPTPLTFDQGDPSMTDRCDVCGPGRRSHDCILGIDPLSRDHVSDGRR